jgi:hypothetical protein
VSDELKQALLAFFEAYDSSHIAYEDMSYGLSKSLDAVIAVLKEEIISGETEGG